MFIGFFIIHYNTRNIPNKCIHQKIHKSVSRLINSFIHEIFQYLSKKGSSNNNNKNAYRDRAFRRMTYMPFEKCCRISFLLLLPPILMLFARNLVQILSLFGIYQHSTSLFRERRIHLICYAPFISSNARKKRSMNILHGS